MASGTSASGGRCESGKLTTRTSRPRAQSVGGGCDHPNVVGRAVAVVQIEAFEHHDHAVQHVVAAEPDGKAVHERVGRFEGKQRGRRQLRLSRRRRDLPRLPERQRREERHLAAGSDFRPHAHVYHPPKPARRLAPVRRTCQTHHGQPVRVGGRGSRFREGDARRFAIPAARDAPQVRLEAQAQAGKRRALPVQHAGAQRHVAVGRVRRTGKSGRRRGGSGVRGCWQRTSRSRPGDGRTAAADDAPKVRRERRARTARWPQGDKHGDLLSLQGFY